MGQKNQLWWDLPAGDSFELHREIYAIPPAEFRETLSELTELLGVEKLTRQAVRELSLGERMKMELIAALLHRPKLLLLDEPTIGLDVVAQGMIQRCLRDYHARRGVTTLLTSHYMRDVEALCDRVLVITHGTLVYDGPLVEDCRAIQRDRSWSSSSSRRTRPRTWAISARSSAAKDRGPTSRSSARPWRKRLGGDPRPPCRGRRECRRAAAGRSHLPGLRGGPYRP